MIGKVLHATSKYTGTSTVGTEALGETTISVDSVKDFVTDAGFVSINGEIYPYDSVDRNLGTLHLIVALKAEAKPGTIVRQFPYSIQRWVLIESQDGQTPVDAVWALLPHALAAFIPSDGRRDSTTAETVEYQQDGTTFLVTDVKNRMPEVQPESIPDGLITETMVSPGAITTPLLAANAVATQNLQAGSVTGTTISSDALNGKVITGALVRSAATGKRVELSTTGLVQIDADGNVILSIGDTNRFTGSVDATDMIIRDSLQLFGKNNLFAVGSKVTLKASTSAPTTAPTLAWDYEVGPAISTKGWYVSGIHTDNGGANKYTTEIFWQTASYNTPAGTYTWPAKSGEAADVSQFKPWTYVRISRPDGLKRLAVMLGENRNSIGANGFPDTFINIYDDSNMVPDGSVAPQLLQSAKWRDFSWFKEYRLMRYVSGAVNTTGKAYFGTIEADAQLGGGPKRVQVALYLAGNDGSVALQQSWDLGFVMDEDEVLAGGVMGGSSSMGIAGTNRAGFILMTSKRNRFYNTVTNQFEDNAAFPRIYGAQDRAWAAGDIPSNQVDFLAGYNWAMGTDITSYKYANNHVDGTTLPTYWASYVWRGEASQAFRTQQSPKAFLTLRKKASLRVTMPSLPAPLAGVGFARDPAKDVYGWIYYVGSGVSEPIATAMWQQNNQPNMVANTPMAVSSVLLTSTPIASGTSAPTANTFPASAAASIESDNGLLKITGDGKITADELLGGAIDKLWDLLMPPGKIIWSADNVAPYKCLPCDGAAVSRTTYAVLFAKIGTTYGVGNGSTTFNVPRMQGRSPIGVGASDTGSAGNNYSAGQKFGHEALQAHNHSVGADQAFTNAFGNDGSLWAFPIGRTYAGNGPMASGTSGTGNSGNVHPVLAHYSFIRY